MESSQKTMKNRFPETRKPSLSSPVDIPKLAKDVRDFLFQNANDEYAVLTNGARLYPINAVIVPGVTATDAPEGSFGLDQAGSIVYRSDGDFWQVPIEGLNTKTSGADIDIGIDDIRFLTAKSITDSRVLVMPEETPELSAEPTNQNIADVLAGLGLVSQAGE